MKRLFWLLPAVLLLVAAFFAPKLLLASEIDDYTASRSAVAAPAAPEQSISASLMDALLLLSDRDTEFLYYSMREGTESEELKTAFFVELEALYSADAITSSMQTMFSADTISISDYYLVNSASGTTLFLHEIHDAATDSYALYEPKSGKIIKLLYYLNTANLLWEAENQYGNDAAQNYERQLNAWASYYSLTADNYSFNVTLDKSDATLPEGLDNYEYAAVCTLRDENGRQVGIGLDCIPISESISWHVLPAQWLEYLTASAINTDAVTTESNIENS